MEESEEQWTLDVPKEAGKYWFFGYTDYEFAKKNNQEPCLHYVKVAYNDHCGFFVADGHFMYRQQFYGKWSKVIIPDLPKLEDKPKETE